MDKGYIYLGAYEGWYSVRDECYYNESELIDGKAPTGAEVTWVTKEDSYFFKLSAFEDKLLEYYEENPEFIAPQSRLNEVSTMKPAIVRPIRCGFQLILYVLVCFRLFHLSKAACVTFP